MALLLILALAVCGEPADGPDGAAPMVTASIAAAVGSATSAPAPSPGIARWATEDAAASATIAAHLSGTVALPAPPPPGTLAYGGQTQTGGFGTYCWTSGCLLMRGIPVPAETLLAPARAVLVFTFGGTTPLTELTASAYRLESPPTPAADGTHWLDWRGARGSDLPVAWAGRQAEITAAVPAGEYVIFVRTRTQGGSPSYGFHVVVQ